MNPDLARQYTSGNRKAISVSQYNELERLKEREERTKRLSNKSAVMYGNMAAGFSRSAGRRWIPEQDSDLLARMSAAGGPVRPKDGSFFGVSGSTARGVLGDNISQNLLGTFGGGLQLGLAGIQSTKTSAQYARNQQEMKMLRSIGAGTGAHRMDQANRTLYGINRNVAMGTIMGKAGIGAMGGLMSGAGAGAGALKGLATTKSMMAGIMGAGGMPLMLGMIGASIIPALMKGKQQQKLSIRPKQLNIEEKKYSRTFGYYPHITRLASSGAIDAFQQMSLNILMDIEAHTALTAQYALDTDTDNRYKRGEKDSLTSNYKSNYGKMKANNGIFAKMGDGLDLLEYTSNKVNLKYNPIAQLFHFITTGEGVGKALKEIDDVRKSKKQADDARKDSKTFGMRSSLMQLMRIDPSSLAKGSYEDIMVSSNIGQFTMLQYLAQEVFDKKLREKGEKGVANRFQKDDMERNSLLKFLGSIPGIGAPVNLIADTVSGVNKIRRGVSNILKKRKGGNQQDNTPDPSGGNMSNQISGQILVYLDTINDNTGKFSYNLEQLNGMFATALLLNHDKFNIRDTLRIDEQVNTLKDIYKLLDSQRPWKYDDANPISVNDIKSIDALKDIYNLLESQRPWRRDDGNQAPIEYKRPELSVVPALDAKGFASGGMFFDNGGVGGSIRDRVLNISNRNNELKASRLETDTFNIETEQKEYLRQILEQLKYGQNQNVQIAKGQSDDNGGLFDGLLKSLGPIATFLPYLAGIGGAIAAIRSGTDNIVRIVDGISKFIPDFPKLPKLPKLPDVNVPKVDVPKVDVPKKPSFIDKIKKLKPVEALTDTASKAKNILKTPVSTLINKIPAVNKMTDAIKANPIVKTAAAAGKAAGNIASKTANAASKIASKTGDVASKALNVASKVPMAKTAAKVLKIASPAISAYSAHQNMSKSNELAAAGNHGSSGIYAAASALDALSIAKGPLGAIAMGGAMALEKMGDASVILATMKDAENKVETLEDDIDFLESEKRNIEFSTQQFNERGIPMGKRELTEKEQTRLTIIEEQLVDKKEALDISQKALDVMRENSDNFLVKNKAGRALTKGAMELGELGAESGDMLYDLKNKVIDRGNMSELDIELEAAEKMLMTEGISDETKKSYQEKYLKLKNLKNEELAREQAENDAKAWYNPTKYFDEGGLSSSSDALAHVHGNEYEVGFNNLGKVNSVKRYGNTSSKGDDKVIRPTGTKAYVRDSSAISGNLFGKSVNELSALNVAGGGKAFMDGGIMPSGNWEQGFSEINANGADIEHLQPEFKQALGLFNKEHEREFGFPITLSGSESGFRKPGDKNYIPGSNHSGGLAIDMGNGENLDDGVLNKYGLMRPHMPGSKGMPAYRGAGSRIGTGQEGGGRQVNGVGWERWHVELSPDGADSKLFDPANAAGGGVVGSTAGAAGILGKSNKVSSGSDPMDAIASDVLGNLDSILGTSGISSLISGFMGSDEETKEADDFKNQEFTNIKYDGKQTIAKSIGDKLANNQHKDNIVNAIKAASDKYKLPTSLISGIIQTESGFNTEAESGAGAKGLMQLMPGTAKDLGVHNPFDPVQSIMGGTSYIKQMIERESDNQRDGLYAYNFGPGNFDKYQRKEIQLPEETQKYAPAVLSHAKKFQDEIDSGSYFATGGLKPSADDMFAAITGEYGRLESQERERRKQQLPYTLGDMKKSTLSALNKAKEFGGIIAGKTKDALGDAGEMLVEELGYMQDLALGNNRQSNSSTKTAAGSNQSKGKSGAGSVPSGTPAKSSSKISPSNLFGSQFEDLIWKLFATSVSNLSSSFKDGPFNMKNNLNSKMN